MVYNHIWARGDSRAPTNEFRQCMEMVIDSCGDASRAMVCDVACGHGRHVRYASELGAKVVAVEYDATALCGLVNVDQSRVKVIKADARHWLAETPAPSFDACVCFDAIHHMYPEEDGFLHLGEQLRGIVRDGGYLLLPLLHDIRYSNGIVPVDRLNVTPQKAEILLEKLFASDELLVRTDNNVDVERTLTFDLACNSLEARYEARRTSRLVRIQK